MYINCSAEVCNLDILSEEEEHESFFEEHYWYFIIPASILLAISIILDFFTKEPFLSQLIAAISILLSSYGVVSEAIKNVKERKITANLLMLIAAVASFFILHGQEGATAILLYSIAEHIEELTTEKSKSAIKQLLELAPDEALLKKDKEYIRVPTSSVELGNIIGVKPGMKIPLDGIIVKGNCYVNESAITGESIPVFKKVNDEVYAGTLVTDNFIDIKITKDSSNTLVAQIARSIQDALKNKSKKEKFIERFARYYTPIILASAIFVMIVPPLVFNLDFNSWFYKGLVLLVVSCPCALTLSTPLTNIAALTKLAREGILVKGNRYIELVNELELFAFDKTGTLTEGNLRVYEIKSYNSSAQDVLSIAASLENLSEHPIAKAILRYAKEQAVPLISVEQFEIFPGKGIKGKINGEIYFVGNNALIKNLDYEIPRQDMEEIERTGTIPILVGNEKNLLGIITIRDVLRLDAPILINGLKERKYKTVLISGDKQTVCNSIGSSLDIDEIRGELIPEQKNQEILELKKKYKGVAMVGDGINDAPALTTSDLGIAIGASATDLTLETADVIIMNDRLVNILKYIDISKKANRIIKQNIWTSIIIKVSFAILTVLGLMTLWLAVGIGDVGVSLLVFANGLRVFRYKNVFESIDAEMMKNEAKILVCNNCQTRKIIPQHHGRDMILEDDKLVCWRKMLIDENLEPCEEELPLDCPICNQKYDLQ